MARFTIGSRVRINVTIGSIYNKTGTIVGYAQIQNASSGECYTTPVWRILLDGGRCISISEKYLNPDRG